MEKKTIFLELPTEMVDKIDSKNTVGDRSQFVSHLLEKQLQEFGEMDYSIGLNTRMDDAEKPIVTTGEISLFNNRGNPVGKFDIDTVEGFESLAHKISEMSNDPIVRMKARRWR